MLFSEEEVLAILKKNLPDKSSGELEGVARSIMEATEHWQEADLHEKLHDEEVELLNQICKKKNPEKEPKEFRLFFKH